MRSLVLIVSCFALLVLAGCSSSDSASTTSTPSPGTAPAQQAAPTPNQDLTIDTSASGISGQVSDADLAKRKKDYETAKKAFAAKASPQTTDDYIVATASYGSATMLAANLDAKTKYRGALGLYRETLKQKPTGDKAKKFSSEAQKNENVIVNIYKMMGRPVPE